MEDRMVSYEDEQPEPQVRYTNTDERLDAFGKVLIALQDRVARLESEVLPREMPPNWHGMDPAEERS